MDFKDRFTHKVTPEENMSRLTFATRFVWRTRLISSDEIHFESITNKVKDGVVLSFSS